VQRAHGGRASRVKEKTTSRKGKGVTGLKIPTGEEGMAEEQASKEKWAAKSKRGKKKRA